MTDLEMTKLCAEAMGHNPINVARGHVTVGEWKTLLVEYDPLHDDAQAMALVKQLRLHICPSDLDFGVWPIGDDPDSTYGINHKDLNRAICECVAKMQQAKS